MNLQFPYPWADLHIFENGIWNLPKYRVTCSTMIPEHKSVCLCICLSVSLPRKYLPRLRRVFCFHLLLCALGKFCASASHWITSDKDNNFSMKLLEGKKETWHSTSKPQHTCWFSLRYAVRRTGSYFDQGRFKCSRKSSLIPCLFWPVLAKWHKILRRKLDLESDCLCLKFIIAFTYLLVCVCARSRMHVLTCMYTQYHAKIKGLWEYVLSCHHVSSWGWTQVQQLPPLPTECCALTNSDYLGFITGFSMC